MLMTQPLVTVPMGVRPAVWVTGGMGMLMMLIMHVRMRMLHGCMFVLVVVILGEVQPHT